MNRRSDASPIEDYLDELLVSLRGQPPRQARHLVSEAEAHLHDVAAELARNGATDLDAETEAVMRFGSADAIAHAERRAAALSGPAVAARVALSGLLLGSTGAIAVGASGLVAGAIRLIGGVGSLVDPRSGSSFSAESCARWLALDPSAPTCRAAALNDWAFETIAYRVALGVLGVLALVAYLGIRPVARRRGIGLLPRTISDAVALTLFGAAGLWTLSLGIDAALLRQGWGQWISAAVVSLVAGAFFGRRVVGSIRADSEGAVRASVS